MNAAAAGHSKAVAELARMLGLDPNRTRKVDLYMHFDDLVIVKAEMYVGKDQLDDFVEVIKKYELVEIKE